MPVVTAACIPSKVSDLELNLAYLYLVSIEKAKKYECKSCSKHFDKQKFEKHKNANAKTDFMWCKLNMERKTKKGSNKAASCLA